MTPEGILDVMSTVGLVGGMSWHSTAEYYRLVNERVAGARGGHASARLVLTSLDFAEVRRLQLAEDWDAAGDLLTSAALTCVAAGAEVVAICTNLMHKVAPRVEDGLAGTGVPLLHIADAVAAEASRAGASRVGLVATRWVMEEEFYAERLARHGVSTVVPDADERIEVDRVVFEELTQGVVRASSRAAYVAAIEGMAARGAEAVVLACTEIGLLLGPDDSPLPLVDSCAAHAAALADVALDLTPSAPGR